MDGRTTGACTMALVLLTQSSRSKHETTEFESTIASFRQTSNILDLGVTALRITLKSGKLMMRSGKSYTK